MGDHRVPRALSSEHHRVFINGLLVKFDAFEEIECAGTDFRKMDVNICGSHGVMVR